VAPDMLESNPREPVAAVSALSALASCYKACALPLEALVAYLFASAFFNSSVVFRAVS